MFVIREESRNSTKWQHFNVSRRFSSFSYFVSREKCQFSTFSTDLDLSPSKFSTLLKFSYFGRIVTQTAVHR